MTEHWRVTVDHDMCVHTGLCAATAPDALTLDRDGQGIPLADTVPPGQALRDAAEGCPVEAITITGADTGTQIFPPP